MRITLVYQSTFCINSLCHTLGSAPYDPDSTAKDNWFSALSTNGEGYHNFHHRFPSDYRNAVRWYQFDPSKWLIATLEKLGLAWDLKQVSQFRILAARLYAQNVCMARALDALEKKKGDAAQAQEVWKARYEEVRRHLTEWQSQFESYQALLCERVNESSRELQTAAHKKMKIAKRQFKAAHEQWKDLSSKSPIQLKLLLLARAA